MSDYEAWRKAEQRWRKNSILNQIDAFSDQLRRIRFAVENDQPLNDVGELQALGPMLDAAIAAYATQRQALKNYLEMQ